MFFNKDYLTPKYEYYDYDHQDGTPDSRPEQLTLTPEIGDNYFLYDIVINGFSHVYVVWVGQLRVRESGL